MVACAFQITTGFSNWKDGASRILQHQQSEQHKEAHDELYILPGQTRDVGEILNTELAVQKVENSKILLILLRSIAFLARQGLALRGDGKEVDSNFRQLLLLQATENKKITEWLSKPTNTFTSKDIQNEILS